MNILKKILISISLMMICTNSTLASSNAVYYTIDPVDISDTSVYIRGDFYVYDEVVPMVYQLWFQYGKDSTKLFERTKEITVMDNNSIHSSKLINLDANTNYFYRTVLKDGSDIRYGNILDFTTSKKNIDSDSDKENLFNYKPFSFYDIFKWRSKNKKPLNKSHDVQNEKKDSLEEDISNINKLQTGKSIENHNNKSAAYNDELGEIIEFNKKYQSRKIKKNSNLNYPILLLVIILLAIALVLVRLILLRKRKKVYQYNRTQQQVVPKGSSKGRYYIPVKRDLHDSKQNPNKFFEKDNSN